LKLTFDNGKFLLSKQASLKTITIPIHEAARFRKHADDKAERILNKLLLKKVPFPSGRPIPTPEGLSLRPFQAERGIPFILSQNRTYLAHQPGLGKSAQFICAVGMKPGRALVICPAFLKTNWAREITKWFVNDFPTIAIVGDEQFIPANYFPADFVIVSDAMIAKPEVLHALTRTKFYHIAIDEGHRFKTFDANRTVALFGGNNGKVKSSGLIYNSDHVVVLSGTPMLNRPVELWPLLYAMAPELIDFMSFETFGFRYGGAKQDEFGRWTFNGSSNEEELHKRIMGPFIQRIKKEDVLPELPEKIREIIVVEKDSRDGDTKTEDKKLLRKMNPFHAESFAELAAYAKMRHAIGLAKVKWVAEFITNNISTGESIILFAHHRDVVEKLAEELIAFAPMIINGGVRDEERTKIQDLFQSGKRKLIIGNIDAMNLGLTLTKATRVVFAEYAWTPAANEQAEDRAHRIGQHDSVLCQYIVLPDSMDESILEANIKKEDSIQRVIG
jgi:SWI/SNF-related matrix-associated actin-dependent regulator 1 of chromatin subfamily A